MSAQIGALRVTLGLNSAEFQTGLDKSAKKLDAFARDGEKAAGKMGNAFATMGSAALTFGKTLAVGLAAGAAANGVAIVAGIARGIAEVGDQAKRAGVGIEAFSALKYVAEQNRIGVDALTDGLKEMNLRADEFISTGSGSAAEAFQRLGYNAEQLREKLKDPSALFTEIIGKLKQLDAAAQIRIADEIFGGTGGEQFVQLIEQGEDGLRSAIQAAHDLGKTLDSDTVAKANDLNVAFQDVATTVGTSLQQAIVNASYALFDFLQQFKAVEERTSNNLELRLNDLGRDIVNKDRERLEALSSSRSDPMKAGLYSGFAAQLEQEIASLREEEAKILQVLQDRKAPIALPGSTVAPTVPGVAAGGRGGSGSRSSAISDIERQKNAVQDLIIGLEFERSLIGLSAVEQQKLTLLRQAGAAATDEQRAQIAALVDVTHAEQLRVDQLASTFDILGQAGTSALNGIADAFADGKIEGQELLGILSNILSTIGSSFLNQGSTALIGGLSTMEFNP